LLAWVCSERGSGHFWLLANFVDDFVCRKVHLLFLAVIVPITAFSHHSTHDVRQTLQKNLDSVRALFRNCAYGFIVYLAATSDCDLYIRRKLAPQNFLAHRNQRTLCKIVKEREAQHVCNLNHRIFPHDSNHLRLMPPF
jgi:hypothetical protein